MNPLESFSFNDFLNISGLSYSDGLTSENFVVPEGYSFVDRSSNMLSGFNGVSFYNAESNTLAIGIAGTNSSNPFDLLQDYGVMVGGATAQVFDADLLTKTSLEKLAARGITNPNIVYTGHSLGGLVAQSLVVAHPNTQAVVFNSPGMFGLWGDFKGLPGGGVGLPVGRVTYVYSENWGTAGELAPISTGHLSLNQEA